MGSAEAKWKFHKTLDVVPRSNAIGMSNTISKQTADLQPRKPKDHFI